MSVLFDLETSDCIVNYDVQLEDLHVLDLGVKTENRSNTDGIMALPYLFPFSPIYKYKYSHKYFSDNENPLNCTHNNNGNKELSYRQHKEYDVVWDQYRWNAQSS